MTLDTRRSLRQVERRRYTDEGIAEDEIDGKRTYSVDEKLADPKFVNAELHARFVKQLTTGEEFSVKYIQQNGFETPFIIKDKTGLGLRVPSQNFHVDDVRRLVGSHRLLDVMDVETQKDLVMTMKDWCKYFKAPVKHKLLNVISLEFSKTKLEDYVDMPRVVKELDWVNSVWPVHLLEAQHVATNNLSEMKYPKVRKYVLMSVAGCYTDFHLDFGGTSVWYHILHGAKIFWLIPPTERNYKLYLNWTLSANQGEVFLGDLADDCIRVYLEAGDTFLLPTGWIHAVYTPKESLVFGGNFLHSFSIPQQLKVSNIEDLTHVTAKFRYPFYTEIHWFVLEKYMRILTGKSFLSIPKENLDKDSIFPEQHELNPNFQHIHITKWEFESLRSLINYVTTRPQGKQNIPALITDPEGLIKEAQQQLALHCNDSSELAVTGKHILTRPDTYFRTFNTYSESGFEDDDAMSVSSGGLAYKNYAFASSANLKASAGGRIGRGRARRRGGKFRNQPNPYAHLAFIPADKVKDPLYSNVLSKRRIRCMKCEACLREDCKECVMCRGMTKFGGPGTLKKPCMSRQCMMPQLPRSTVCSVCQTRDPPPNSHIVDPDFNPPNYFECIYCRVISHPECLYAYIKLETLKNPVKPKPIIKGAGDKPMENLMVNGYTEGNQKEGIMNEIKSNCLNSNNQIDHVKDSENIFTTCLSNPDKSLSLQNGHNTSSNYAYNSRIVNSLLEEMTNGFTQDQPEELDHKIVNSDNDKPALDSMLDNGMLNNSATHNSNNIVSTSPDNDKAIVNNGHNTNDLNNLTNIKVEGPADTGNDIIENTAPIESRDVKDNPKLQVVQGDCSTLNGSEQGSLEFLDKGIPNEDSACWWECPNCLRLLASYDRETVLSTLCTLTKRLLMLSTATEVLPSFKNDSLINGSSDANEGLTLDGTAIHNSADLNLFDESSLTDATPNVLDINDTYQHTNLSPITVNAPTTIPDSQKSQLPSSFLTTVTPNDNLVKTVPGTLLNHHPTQLAKVINTGLLPPLSSTVDNSVCKKRGRKPKVDPQYVTSLDGNYHEHDAGKVNNCAKMASLNKNDSSGYEYPAAKRKKTAPQPFDWNVGLSTTTANTPTSNSICSPPIYHVKSEVIDNNYECISPEPPIAGTLNRPANMNGSSGNGAAAAKLIIRKKHTPATSPYKHNRSATVIKSEFDCNYLSTQISNDRTITECLDNTTVALKTVPESTKACIYRHFDQILDHYIEHHYKNQVVTPISDTNHLDACQSDVKNVSLVNGSEPPKNQPATKMCGCKCMCDKNSLDPTDTNTKQQSKIGMVDRGCQTNFEILTEPFHDTEQNISVKKVLPPPVNLTSLEATKDLAEIIINTDNRSASISPDHKNQVSPKSITTGRIISEQIISRNSRATC